MQLLAVVVILVVAALVVALVARAVVARRKPPAELPPAGKRETLELPKIEAQEVAPPAERLAREQRARDELEKVDASLKAAREALGGAPDSAAARAEVQRYERELADLSRKLEYEKRKTAEAVEKARKLAEAAAREEAEARLKAEEKARAEQARRAEEAARQKLVEEETGRTLSEGLARTRGGFMARLNALVGGARELDDAALGELEEILFSADVGVKTATALLESVRAKLKRKELSNLSKVKEALREEIE